MYVRFDGGEVPVAVAHLETDAEAARRLASAAGRLGADVDDAALAEGLRVLGDLCGDVLEVGGLALDRLAAKTRAGAACYHQVEGGVSRSVAGGGVRPR